MAGGPVGLAAWLRKKWFLVGLVCVICLARAFPWVGNKDGLSRDLTLSLACASRCRLAFDIGTAR